MSGASHRAALSKGCALGVRWSEPTDIRRLRRPRDLSLPSVGPCRAKNRKRVTSEERLNADGAVLKGPSVCARPEKSHPEFRPTTAPGTFFGSPHPSHLTPLRRSRRAHPVLCQRRSAILRAGHSVGDPSWHSGRRRRAKVTLEPPLGSKGRSLGYLSPRFLLFTIPPSLPAMKSFTVAAAAFALVAPAFAAPAPFLGLEIGRAHV